ncbi:hypothetical protein F2Q69_00001370 [Brassica cretica]|uniref:Pseudouridine synthase RsuA/RluA-like domain-containing protein n=1 Tax=Brassica cretica TaxID=69181 RepID=A0A8S9NS97_BRACR|nr:hypothetical protein F2Q69_00001370 [Brassica cretica]
MGVETPCEAVLLRVHLSWRRHVRPYYFEFISHVNKRWTGKTIVDLFADEFKGRPPDYYVGAVKSGRIKVDGETVPVSYIVRSSQKITHFVHRHEPPVMTDDVQILVKEDDVVTVCKPASVPVHPCGQYRKNTVVGILDAEHDLGPLFPIHRLDRSLGVRYMNVNQRKVLLDIEGNSSWVMGVEEVTQFDGWSSLGGGFMKSDAKRLYRHGFYRTSDNREGDGYTSSEETHD